MIAISYLNFLFTCYKYMYDIINILKKYQIVILIEKKFEKKLV